MDVRGRLGIKSTHHESADLRSDVARGGAGPELLLLLGDDRRGYRETEGESEKSFHAVPLKRRSLLPFAGIQQSAPKGAKLSIFRRSSRGWIPACWSRVVPW